MSRFVLSGFVALTFGSLIVLSAGCDATRSASPPSRAEDPAAPAQPTTTDYPLIGVVKQVDRESGLVAIHHEEIPDFMPEMTMPFSLKGQWILDELQPEDEVAGILRVESVGGEVQQYEVVDLNITRPAPAPAMTLSLAGGQPELKAVPSRLEPGEAVPDFTMTTQDGESLRLSDLRGQVVVLTFIYTRCPLPNFCPLMDRKFGDLADRLTAAGPTVAPRVRLLSISFDPEHDTPEILRRHAAIQGAQPPLWTFAVASHQELFQVAAPLGLTYGPTGSEIRHDLSTAVIDPDGNLARLEAGGEANTWSTASMFQTIKSLLPSSHQ